MIKFFESLRKDQQKHFFLCFVLNSVAFLLFNQHNTFLQSILYAFTSINIFMFIFKEVIWDKLLRRGTFDLSDCYANLLGSGSASIVILIMFGISKIFGG